MCFLFLCFDKDNLLQSNLAVITESNSCSYADLVVGPIDHRNIIIMM